jgi:cytochrome P450
VALKLIILSLNFWDFSFGHRFGLVHEGKDEEHIQHLVDDGMKFTAVVAHFPWATGTLTKLPGRGASQRRLKQFGAAHVHQRIAAGSKYKDLFYHLIDEEGLEPEKPSRPTVTSDGVLAVIAGSDTTATSLAVLWHYLMLNPTAYKRLQEEIDGYFPPDEEPLDYAKMARMPFLNACINEALRLLPPLLSGAQRSVLPGTGGKQVGPL